MSSIIGGLGIGGGIAAGGAVSQVLMLPFSGANNFIGSAYFGYGMILGERYMYQQDWPKIQARLAKGENIHDIIGEYVGTFSAIVMQEAKLIFSNLSDEFKNIMAEMIGLQPPQGEPAPPPPTTEPPVPPPVIGGIVQPPVEVPLPIPPKKVLTKAIIIQLSVGKIRKGMSYGVWYYSYWSKNPDYETSTNKGYAWTKLTGQRQYTSLAKLRDWVNLFLLPKDYRVFMIGIDVWYYVPRKFLVDYQV